MQSEDEAEVDLDELMGRIRQTVQRRRDAASGVAVPPEVPPVASESGGDGGLSPPDLLWVHSRLDAAEQAADVGERLPPMHRQRGLQRGLATVGARVFLRFAQMVSRDQRQFNHALIEAVRGLATAVGDLGRGTSARLETAAAAAALQETALGGLRQELGARVGEIAEWQTRLESRVAAAAEAHAKAASQAQAVGAEQARSAAEAQTSAAALAVERARLVEARLGALEQAAGHGASRVAALQVAQVLQERRISTVLEAVRRQPEPSGEPAARVVDREQEHLLDPMYAEFEDAWRGTREAIKERARASMLAPVRAAGAGTPDRPLLDLGCGRGEWLELLAEEGLVGRGIDLNRVFIQQCQERHLAVEEADALAHLRSLPDACLGAVTAIHLLEHLPFSMLVAILDETVRVLKPGGIAVFETPNPTNLAVGASDFYRDPTHRNPLHPETMQFLAERRGLVRVAVLPLHPAPMEQRVLEDGTALPRWINEHFRGPRDYALVGYRA